MGRRIELPQTPAGKPEDQLKALYSYLYQMAETLNSNLAEIGGAELSDSEMKIIREIIGPDQTADGRSEAETLKSLIIKTASFVKSKLDEYRLNLLGEYVAEGKFGKYVRKTGLDVDVTPTGIQQNYTFQEIIQGLKTYEINAKNYIKTGLLRTVSSIPVYGVAIGKDVVTFAEDGTETYNDGNKVAELTADELSFWQGGTKIASYKGNRISFYYGSTEAFYIASGKLYCANDIEITSGKKLIITTDNFTIDSSGNVTMKGNVQILSGKSMAIKSGGTFTVDSGNFSIDSSGNVAFKGDVQITSGKSMAIKSGGTFSVDSGNFSIDSSGNVAFKGDVQITSGKSMAIKSGGSISIDSGNFSVDTSGNVTVKGAAEILAGKELKVKSGADLNVESGGDVNIKSGGKMTVENGGDIDVSSGGDININNGANLNINNGGDIEILNGGDIEVASGGDINIANGGKISIASGGDLDVASGGDININSGANLNIESGGDIEIKNGGDIEVASGGNVKINNGGKISIASGGDIDVASGGDVNINNGGKLNIESGGDIEVKSGGDLNIQSGGDIDVASGGNVNINSGGKLNVESGGDFEVKSGGDLIIKSGGTVSIDSGNFSVDSSGNVAVKGAAEILSGKELKIKSGAGLNVESGGDVSIQSGGSLKIKSGSSNAIVMDEDGIDMLTAGKVNIHAKDGTSSSITFGTNTANATFAVGMTGDVKAGAITADSLSVNGIMVPTIIVSETQPSGNNIVWVKPSNASEKQWQFTPGNYNLNNQGGQIYTYYREYSVPYAAADYLSGNLYYGIKVRLYYFGSSYRTVSLAALIKNGSSWIEIGRVSSGLTANSNQKLEAISAQSPNIMDVNGGNFTVRLETNLDSGLVRLNTEAFTLKAMSQGGGGGYSACSVFYKG